MATTVEKILTLLEQRGWTQGYFESMAGLSANRISKWKNDQGEPTLRQGLRMARLLGVPIEYLADDQADAIEQPPALTADEDAILKLVRALRLDVSQAMCALANAGRHEPGRFEVIAERDTSESLRRDIEQMKATKTNPHGKP